jgi:hypothetical protein
MQCESMWLATIAGEGKSAPRSVGAGGSHHRRQLKRLGVAISFFPVTAPEEVKERDWKATGNLPVTGRGGEGEHTERRHAATMLICEEEEHCAAGSDGTMKDDDSGKNGKMMWILCMLREIIGKMMWILCMLREII